MNWFSVSLRECGRPVLPERPRVLCARGLRRSAHQARFRARHGRTPRGVRVYNAHPNRFLTYTVQAFEDGSALLSFEFALGEYLATKGIQVGSDEELNCSCTLDRTSAALKTVRGSWRPSSTPRHCSRTSGLTGSLRLPGYTLFGGPMSTIG